MKAESRDVLAKGHLINKLWCVNVREGEGAGIQATGLTWLALPANLHSGFSGKRHLTCHCWTGAVFTC
jgi:hypothetical protein